MKAVWLSVPVALAGGVGTGFWYGRNKGYDKGYEEGLHDGLPSIGSCSNCGYETEPGTLFEISEAVLAHSQSCEGRRGY